MWNESLILIRLSQAKFFLEKLHQAQCEDFNLWQFRIRVKCNRDEQRGVDKLELANASQKEDENVFGFKFLLGLLKCPNQKLAHAAMKALVELSDFLRNSRRHLWPSFLLVMWKDAQCWVTCPDPSSLKKVQEYGKAFIQNGQSQFRSQAHQDACLIATSNTLQTLQQCLKRCLKLTDENTETETLTRDHVESLEIFLCLLTTMVSKVTTAICTSEDKNVDEQKNDSCTHHVIQGLPRELVLGAILRLLCTGASIPAVKVYPKDPKSVSLGDYLDVSQDLIPIISRSALPPHKSCAGRSCISSYLRHKLLMFMLKLSEWFNTKPSLGSSWYTALRLHGSDLVDFSLQMDNKEKNSSGESPFIESLLVSSKSEALAVPSIRRLQRRALLLLFKIAHAAHAPEDAHRGSASVQRGVILPSKRSWEQLTPQCTCQLPSRIYLRDWMKRQYQLGVTGHFQQVPNLRGICLCVKHLSTSLIQLFLEEDDLLLMMMTQVLNMPFLSSIFMCPKHPTEDMFCRIVVEAFLPSRLFHAFLAAIQYDHSTVEKLLLSKTSGVLCLTYFMRSLRNVSDSWPEFAHSGPCADSEVHFPNRGHELNDWKVKTHTLLCTLCSYEDMCSMGVVPYDKVVIQKYMNLKRNEIENPDCTSGVKISVEATKQITHPHIFQVKECLQQLKLRIKDLHERSLFPYNPTPLLNRLSIVVDLLTSHSTV